MNKQIIALALLLCVILFKACETQASEINLPDNYSNIFSDYDFTYLQTGNDIQLYYEKFKLTTHMRSPHCGFPDPDKEAKLVGEDDDFEYRTYETEDKGYFTVQNGTSVDDFILKRYRMKDCNVDIIWSVEEIPVPKPEPVKQSVSKASAMPVDEKPRKNGCASNGASVWLWVSVTVMFYKQLRKEK